MVIPADLLYTKDHEWLKRNGNRATIGISDYAQDALGDVVFVQAPEVGRAVVAGEMLCEVESTKSVSEIYAPVAGTVVEVNATLASTPELINKDCYGEGWICIIESPNGADDNLLSPDQYREMTET